MITRFAVENYKALRQISVDLTPIHVIIGPNDTGKTSFLEALAALSRSVDYELSDCFYGQWDGVDLAWKRETGRQITFDASFKERSEYDGYGIRFEATRGHRNVNLRQERLFHKGGVVAELPKWVGGTSVVRACSVGNAPQRLRQFVLKAHQIHDVLSGVHFYRWDTRLLALPNATDAQREFRMERGGFGLAQLLGDILSYDRHRFGQIEDRFRDAFPQVRAVRLVTEPAFKAPSNVTAAVPMLQASDGKGIHFELDGGILMPAAQASDGLLLVLAYLAVLYLPEPPRLLLIEEPENGIHPRRVKQVITLLRELIDESSRTQVVMTTHSPYVLDHFEPHEVTLFSKSSDGSVQTRRLSESDIVEANRDVFSLGEIWTGEGDEALSGQTKAPSESSPGVGS